MENKIFEFKTEIFKYPGMDGWYFASVPKKQSEEITKRFGAKKRGWGSFPVEATIGVTNWRTSIFPDKKSGMYLLPLKAQVRKKEKISGNGTIAVTIEIKV